MKRRGNGCEDGAISGAEERVGRGNGPMGGAGESQSGTTVSGQRWPAVERTRGAIMAVRVRSSPPTSRIDSR